MSSSVPDIELLSAYFHGELRAEEEASVRGWLLVHADEEVLAVCDAIVAERERRRDLLASRAEQPVRSKLERALWRARSRMGMRMATLIDTAQGYRLTLAALGPSRAKESTTLEASLREPLHLKLKLSVPCYVAAYAIESWRRMAVLLRDEVRHPADVSIELPGIVLERQEEHLALYVLLDTEAPPPAPGDEDGPEWLAQQIERLGSSTTTWLLKRTIVPASSPR